ncbi:MAG: DUF547 domain-containing protein [Myxococcota bacterium]|nr:DUF547 domain-containing protein [Myxococcota bacterium]MEC8424355.1 DUF547 domain-containing protein [Myxococcota bacterium]
MRHRHALLALPLAAACGQRVNVDREVPEDDPRDAWSALLQESVTEEGVDYDHIDASRSVLQDYVSWLAEHGPVTDIMRESKEDRRIAFLVNAYNAFVIEGVLRNRPLASVKDVAFGPWAVRENWSFFLGQRFKLDGEWISLYHLEQHRILARYQDPRPHVALNCASVGCPPLRWWTEKVGRKKLGKQMDDALEDWLADGALQQTETGYAVTELFFWYEDDFTYWSDADNLCQYLYAYASEDAAAWLFEHYDDCPLESIPYDWSLNGAPTGAAQRKASKEAAVPDPVARPRKRVAMPAAPVEPTAPEAGEETGG